MTRETFIAAHPIDVELERRGIAMAGGGNERRVRCPFHDDKTASMSVNVEKGLWNCHAGCGSGSVIDLIAKFEGKQPADLLRDNGRWTPFKPLPESESKPQTNGAGKIVKTYDYLNESGELVYQVCRLEPKSFRQRRPDGNGGWLYNMDGIERIPYRLPEVISTIKRGLPIFICEGEKDCDALYELKLTATCNPGGAGKWQASFGQFFRGCGGICIVADKDEPGRKHADKVAALFYGKVPQLTVVEVPEGKDAADYVSSGATARDFIDLADKAKPWAPNAAEQSDPLAPTFSIETKRIDLAKPPAKDVEIYRIAGVTVCTAGNLTVTTAPPKTAKSAIISAAIASAITDAPTDADCLGWQSRNNFRKAIIWIDTEQSPYDCWTLLDRTRKRARLESIPSCLKLYGIAGLTAKSARLFLRLCIDQAKAEHGGIHSVFLDGVGDMVADVNDPAECNELVSELHDIAIREACSIASAIHFNPGSEKSRGHLGSQLERKAESNLKLEKDEDCIVLYSERQRRQPISKEDGPRFRWCDDAGMHVSAGPMANERIETMRESFQDVYSQRDAMHYNDLLNTVMTVTRTKERQAARKIREAVMSGVIIKSAARLYTLA